MNYIYFILIGLFFSLPAGATSLTIPDIATTFSDMFGYVNVILTNFWPLLVLVLGLTVGFGIIKMVINSIRNHF